MSPKVKRVLSALFILFSIAAVVVIAFSNQELGNAWEAISRLDRTWLSGIFLCWVGYAFFEAAGTWFYLRGQGYGIRLPRVLGSTLIGFYYSNITPSAAGGQPMQINSLRKAGIPVGYGTLAITVRFAANQFVICLLSLVLWLLNREFVRGQLGGVLWAARIGLVINFAAVPLVLLAAFWRKGLQRLTERLIALGAKIRLVRDPEEAVAHATEALDTYHEALTELMHRPGQILLQLICSVISLLGLTGSVVFTYYALGQRGIPWPRVLTLSSLLFVSASYTPLPGASGAQEGGFLLYFRDIFRDGTIGLGLLIWRFFTYYLFLIVGLFTVINEKFLLRREKRNEASS
ncbi:MAG: flippase-like domain-containing protein [Clostridia bacterium]|nr:flippase-like domain-containing protein [Clostridia bacterium]